jgi:hypothetical protein
MNIKLWVMASASRSLQNPAYSTSETMILRRIDEMRRFFKASIDKASDSPVSFLFSVYSIFIRLQFPRLGSARPLMLLVKRAGDRRATMRHAILILGALFSFAGLAKTKVDVSDFADQTKQNPCRAVEHWKKDIGFALKQQLKMALESSGHFAVVEPELYRARSRPSVDEDEVSTVPKKSTFRPSHYSIVGSISSFNTCETKNSTSAEVELKIRVIDVSNGSTIHEFVTKGRERMPSEAVDLSYRGAPFNTGLFRGSPLGLATAKAVRDASDLLKKAFPDRQVASHSGYKLQMLRKTGGRR